MPGGSPRQRPRQRARRTRQQCGDANRRRAEQKRPTRVASRDGEWDAERDADHGDDGRLAHDQTQDALPIGANDHSYPELTGALREAVRERAVETDCCEEQRQSARHRGQIQQELLASHGLIDLISKRGDLSHHQRGIDGGHARSRVALDLGFHPAVHPQRNRSNLERPLRQRHPHHGLDGGLAKAVVLRIANDSDDGEGGLLIAANSSVMALPTGDPSGNQARASVSMTTATGSAPSRS